ncbi:MAG: hypothetical protein ACR2OH_04375, partial [Microthrixaceae bacterium]
MTALPDGPDEPLVRARSAVRGMVRIQIAANGLGALLVGLYFRYLFPAAAEEALEQRSLNVWVFSIFLGAMFLVGLPVNAALLRRAVSWVAEDRPPSVRERRLLFSLPAMETATALVSWFAGAILFGLINTDLSRISVGIALAGIVTCTLLYLLLEGHFRPLFALALRHAELPETRWDVGPRLMLAWLLGSGIPLLAVSLGNYIAPGPLDETRLAWVGAVALAAGAAVMLLAARSVVRPI